MSKKSETSKKYPFIIVIAGFVSIGILMSVVSTPDHTPRTDLGPTTLVSSGPFVIDNDTYKIDEVLFFSVNGIMPGEYGKAVFTSPDGKIANTVFFDGRKNPILNHYFTPASSNDMKNCENCELVGQWTISFEMTEGQNYLPIYFTVESNAIGS